MLRSRIRRCYVALAELQYAVEYLYNHTAEMNEDYVVKSVEQMYKMYREAVCALTDATGPEVFDDEVGVQRAQERLLTTPGVADSICCSIEYVHDGAKSVIRNIEYQLDAGLLSPPSEAYQPIREKAIRALGLIVIILDAIDSGFVQDVRTYNEFGC